MPLPIVPVIDYTLPKAPSTVFETKEPAPNAKPLPTPKTPSS